MSLPQPFPSGNSSFLSCDGCLGDQTSQHSMFPDDANSVHQVYGHNKISDLHQHDGKEMKATEDLLSAELSKLSVQERSKALEDLHCVGEELQESPELIQKFLHEFEQVLAEGNYESYNKAFLQNREYVEDTSFRLRFLRANLYDVNKSVKQMDSLLYYKAKYFGEEKISRDITLDDLNLQARELLESNLFHIQADTDRTGRTIFYNFNRNLGELKPETYIQAHYYLMLNILTPIPSVQIKGVVLVYYDISKTDEKFPIPPIHAMMIVKDYRKSVPVRFTAMHMCLKKGSQSLVSNNTLMKIMLQMLPQYVRVRTRSHYGSDLEIQYSLRSYGISHDSCPMDANGNFRNDIGHAWLNKHLATDADEKDGTKRNAGVDQNSPMMDAHQIIVNVAERNIQAPSAMAEHQANENARLPPVQARIQPLPQDVLLGKGGRLQEHVGNIRFREFVEGFQDDYDQAPRNMRRRVSAQVVQALKGQGVRFLERSNRGEWVESNAKQAENKVGQLFRSRRKVHKKS